MPKTVRIALGKRVLLAVAGRSLREALAQHGVLLRGSCRGLGACGECRVLVDGAPVLSCTYEVTEDVRVEIPGRTLLPLERATCIESGLRGAKLEDVCLAVDLGTTTIATMLLSQGNAVARHVSYNPQIAYGDDVVSRIIYAEDRICGLSEMKSAALSEINKHIDALSEALSFEPATIEQIAVAGNTAMLWILLGRDPSPVRREAVLPEHLASEVLNAAAAGIKAGPATKLVIFPQIASFVGGDLVSGIMATGIHESDQVRVLLDLGTNGEMVLGNNEFLAACACSLGPAFEGGGISIGMPALPGAISHVSLSSGRPVYSTVADCPPQGICGSGLVSLVGEMAIAGAIDRAGRLCAHPLVHGDPLSFCLAETTDGEPLCLTGPDLDAIMRAKAALYAGLTTLLGKVGMPIEDVSEVLLAGGFGTSLDIEAAIDLGMLPDIARHKYKVVGNTSLLGAAILARDPAMRCVADGIARSATYIDLAQDKSFFDAYVGAMFIPHTDLSRFKNARTVTGTHTQGR